MHDHLLGLPNISFADVGLWLQQTWRSTLPSHRSPLRFNLDRSRVRRRVMAKAAPLPLRRLLAQPARNRVAMDVAQLYYEASGITDIMVVVAFLPEWRQALPETPDGQLRDGNLQGLDCRR